jgi:putative flippase GtrA
VPQLPPFVRFLIAGGLNTGATLLLYVCLLWILPPWLSWTISFIAGIAIVTFIYPRFVFASKPSNTSLAANAVAYLVSFFISQGLLALFIYWGSLPSSYSGILVAVVMTPLNFLVSRYFIGKK